MSKKVRNAVTLSGGALVAASPFIATGTAEAATYTVTNLLDSGAGSLRQAIEDANANAATADTITFDAGLTGTITLQAALYVTSPMDIQGPGAGVITIDADGGSTPVFYTRDRTQEAEIAISGLKLTGSDGNSYGGGINIWGDNVTLTNMVITGNTADAAGGIYLDGSYDGDTGTLTIRSSDISGNTGTSYAGGIYVTGGGSTGEEPAPSLVMFDSTVSGNDGAQYGGGLYFDQGVEGDVLIVNSTISGNTATYGGGIYIEGGDLDLTIANSTITGNSATAGDGGGVYLGSSGNEANIMNSVIAGNAATGNGEDIFTNETTTVTANYSLIGDVFGSTLTGANNLTGDPMLGALAANGGIGKTHLPQAGSPLIDAGDPTWSPAPSAASFPTTDQRGRTRVVNSRIDIGAVEVQAATLPPTGGSNGLMATLGAGLLALGGALHLTGRRKRSA